MSKTWCIKDNDDANLKQKIILSYQCHCKRYWKCYLIIVINNKLLNGSDIDCSVQLLAIFRVRCKFFGTVCRCKNVNRPRSKSLVFFRLHKFGLDEFPLKPQLTIEKYSQSIIMKMAEKITFTISLEMERKSTVSILEPTDSLQYCAWMSNKHLIIVSVLMLSPSILCPSTEIIILR